MIKRFIINIRNQPKHKRDKYAFSVAVSLTAVVAMVWLYHVPARINAVVSGVDSTSKPFSSFFESIDDQVATVKESIPEKEELAEIIPPTIDAQPPVTDSNTGDWSLREGGAETSSSPSFLDTVVSPTSTASSTTNDTAASAQARAVRIVTTSATTAVATNTASTP